ncbi:MAG TPA: DEAD/DEAH box helicase [Actinomycetes bacterium]|nr:DEAD/DEAH box helicase [Actinomycetes bacterium]
MPSARTPARPDRRPNRSTGSRPEPHRGHGGRPDPKRSGSGKGKSSRPAGRSATAAQTRAADRELDAWFEKAAAAAPAPTETSFAKLGLPQKLVTALERRDIRSAFPIQAATLGDAMAGHDVLGRAQTGSGKTLAFGLPMIARLTAGRSAPRTPRGLVLVPTRELAVQVRDALEPLGHAVGVKTVAIYGGAAMGRQISTLERGVDIVVATPGRLLDLIERRSCTLAEVEVCVLDEADHMADMGFRPDVRRLLDMTPAGTQRLLFSATLDGAVGQLVRSYLTDPVARAVDPAESHVSTMEHRALVVEHQHKVDVLAEIATRPARTLLFVRTKHGADRLVKQLGRIGVAAQAIHGNRTQGQRQRALDAFARGQSRVLVATDVAARGIHITDVDLVVHADPPNDHKDYLHRSGRTARAGASGVVVSVLGPDQVRPARRLFDKAGVTVDPVSAHPGSQPVRELAESGEPVVVTAAPVSQRPEGSARPARTRRPSRHRGAPSPSGRSRRP